MRSSVSACNITGTNAVIGSPISVSQCSWGIAITPDGKYEITGKLLDPDTHEKLAKDIEKFKLTKD